MENNIQYFKGAKWATLQGSFTAKELRNIARIIEKKTKEFEDSQDGSKK